MFKNLEDYTGADAGYCDLCDNYVPFDYCEDCGEDVCVICHNAYGCDSI